MAALTRSVLVKIDSISRRERSIGRKPSLFKDRTLTLLCNASEATIWPLVLAVRMLHAAFVAAKFAVTLDLSGRQHLDGGQVVLEVGLAQRRMRGADRAVAAARLAGVTVFAANALSSSAS